MSLSSPSTSANNEVESKILEVSLKDIENKLNAVGAKYTFKCLLRAQWMMNTNGEKLRVRQEGKIVRVEHKLITASDVQGIKAAKEVGFTATNFKEVIDTLLVAGFERKGLPSVKRRVSYLIGNEEDGVKLDFDTYIELMGKYGTFEKPVVPTLLEIESKKGMEEVIQTAKLLGFSESDLKDWGPRELFKYYYPDTVIQ